MPMRCFTLLLGFLLATHTFLQAQEDISNPSDQTVIEKMISIEVQTSSDGTLGERVVSIPVKLYIESGVKVEIRDALGYMKFESEATYPEGENDIRIGVGNMDQGLYFVRVSTDLDEQSVIVIVERPQ